MGGGGIIEYVCIVQCTGVHNHRLRCMSQILKKILSLSSYPQSYEAPSFPESLELPSELQVCVILNCLSAKLSDSRSLWPLSVHCVQCIEKLFLNSRINDFLTKHSLVQYNLICFTHTMYHKKVILMYSREKTKI